MAISPYPIDPDLTGIALAYRNSQYIADIVAPYLPVSKPLFEWDEWNIGEMLTVPDTKVGRTSQPNQITFSAIRRQSSTQDYALDAPIPQSDIDAADADIDPKRAATEGVMELIKLDREQRVAAATFNLNSYLASQRATLSGTSQFSDAASTPIATISAALDAALMRPNTMVLGQATWTALRRHPEIVEAVLGTGAAKGMVSREAVAELFEIEQVVVGTGFVNSAKPGQALASQRLWGKHLALLSINPLAQMQGGVSQLTWMATARFGQPVAGSIMDPDLGFRGGVRVRAGESVREVQISQLCGYFFQNAVA